MKNFSAPTLGISSFRVLRSITMFVAVLALFTSEPKLFAQSLHHGEWRTYTSMSGITGIAVERSTGSVWASTSGGAFRFTPSTNNSFEILALRNSDGLSNNELTALAIDSGSGIYFGSASGTIDRYTESDGLMQSIRDISLSTYTNRNIYQLSCFGNRLYIATGFGLSIYDVSKKIFTETITKFGSLSEQDTVFGVTEAKDSIFVLLSSAVASAPKNALNLRDPSAWHITNAPDGVPLHFIHSYSGKIVVGSVLGMFEVVGGGLKSIPLKDSISVATMTSFGGSLYVVDNRNNRILRSTDLSTFTTTDLPTSSNVQSITSLAITNSGKQVFGFAIGGILLETTAGALSQNIFPDGPIDNYIVHLNFAQTLGKLFIAMGTKGISVFDVGGSSWQPLPGGRSVVPAENFTSTFYDSIRLKLWMSSFGGGLWSLSMPTLSSPQRYTYLDNGIPGLNPEPDKFTVMGLGNFDNRGNFITTTWTTSGNGLVSTKDGAHFTATQLNPPTQTISYGVCVEDLDGYFFVATVDHPSPPSYGIIAVAPNGTTYPIPGGTSSLASPSVNALIVDQDNGLWCGTNVGIDVITHSTNFQGLTQFNKPRRLALTDQQVIHSMAVDGVGNKWVGTEDGVFVLSADGSDSLAHFTKSNSNLIDNTVLSVVIDTKRGEAYFGTPKGISRLNSIYQEGESDYSKIRLYPNPVIQNGDQIIELTVSGLVAGSTVKIYSASGRLVATIDGSQTGSTVIWNGKDENGKLLPSGVYIVGAASATSTDYGQTKFVLIRK
ncbi:MAG: FlgD immunoglobulin-like domain containing protein [bacterium]